MKDDTKKSIEDMIQLLVEIKPDVATALLLVDMRSVIESFKNKTVRDGILIKFAELNELEQLVAQNSLTKIATAALVNEEKKQDVGYIIMMCAATLFAFAGKKSIEDTDFNEQDAIDIVKELIEDAQLAGCDDSLLILIDAAIQGNVPSRIFYESIIASKKEAEEKVGK